MRRITACIHRIYGSERGRWIAGVGFALLLYLVAVLLQPVITFYDNDDLNIAWALAGYRSGVPSYSHPFINCVTAAFVSALYALFPSVPWWYAVQTICLLLSVACVAACTLAVCARRGLPAFVPAVLLAVVCAGAYYYAISQVMFTLTSACLGMAAVAMAIAADERGGGRAYAFYLTGGAVLLALAFLIRQSSGLCAACFYFAAMLYRFLCARRAGKGALRVLLTFAAAGALAIGLTAVNSWGRANQNTADFIDFENARASYMDYPHDWEYENPALYESVGWDATLQELVDAWFFMDGRVNADTFTRAADGSTFANLPIPARAAYAWAFFGTFLGKYPIARYLGAITLCAFAALLFVCGRGRRFTELIMGGCVLFGGAALLGFLFYSGRMNLRAWMSILFPAITALLLLTAAGYVGGAGKRGGRAALAACCTALALVSLFCAYKIFRTVVSYDSVETLATTRAVAAYAIAHPDDVYIRDVYTANNFDALTVYPDKKPTNLIDWGGCDTKTRAREAQWKKNGFSSAQDASVFLTDGVYYLCDPAEHYLPLLAKYMRDNYQAGAYEITDWIADTVAVVRFTAQGE